MSDVAGLVSSSLCQGKTVDKSGGIFYRLFLAPKIKYCLTFNECGILEEHKMFTRFNVSKRLLDRSLNSKTIERNISYAIKNSEKIV